MKLYERKDVCKIPLKFVSKVRINNGPDNGFAPGKRQAIIWTNDG